MDQHAQNASIAHVRRPEKGSAGNDNRRDHAGWLDQPELGQLHYQSARYHCHLDDANSREALQRRLFLPGHLRLLPRSPEPRYTEHYLVGGDDPRLPVHS